VDDAALLARLRPHLSDHDIAELGRILDEQRARTRFICGVLEQIRLRPRDERGDGERHLLTSMSERLEHNLVANGTSFVQPRPRPSRRYYGARLRGVVAGFPRSRASV
jgi:hypothetical protein